MRRREFFPLLGATVLAWLAGAVPRGYAFDPAGADGQTVIAAAEGWRLAWGELQGPAARPSLPPT